MGARGGMRGGRSLGHLGRQIQSFYCFRGGVSRHSHLEHTCGVTMEHFVGYHSVEGWGPYDARWSTHYTERKYREETLVDNALWVIEGLAHPRSTGSCERESSQRSVSQRGGPAASTYTFASMAW